MALQNILIVDDEKHTREGLGSALEELGEYETYLARDADEAIALLDSQNFELVLTDLRMAGKSGMSVIEKTLSLPTRPVCIMMTAYGNVETAVEAMRRGAYDFLQKPVNLERLETIVKAALQKRRAAAENRDDTAPAATAHSRKRTATNSTNSKVVEAAAATAANAASARRAAVPRARFDRAGVVGESAALVRVRNQVEQVAPSKATVLLLGETGTGKELFAQMIHRNSPRAAGPFIPVHCAALPANLLESELFGFEKGAFTGAIERRVGRFEAADKGTLFLDEIGEVDAPTQVKLLRFLETRTLERIGSQKPIHVDTRLVCATNKDLRAEVAAGRFREDLFYRLSVVQVRLPPLRERTGDIVPLLDHYLAYFSQENGIPPPALASATRDLLRDYAWPGNIRELRNLCENLVVMHSGQTLDPPDLDPRFHAPPTPESDGNGSAGVGAGAGANFGVFTGNGSSGGVGAGYSGNFGSGGGAGANFGVFSPPHTPGVFPVQPAPGVFSGVSGFGAIPAQNVPGALPASAAGAPVYSVEENEKRLLRQALRDARGNRTLAATLLGVSRRTLHRRLTEWPEIESAP